MSPTVVAAPEMPSAGPEAVVPSLPRWTAVVDLFATLAIVVAVAVIVGGGFRVRVGMFRLAVTSPLGPLLVGLVLLGGRHALHRRPHVLERYRAQLASALRTESWRACWPPFVATRAGLLLVGALAIFTVGYPPGEPRVRASENELLNLPIRWDAGWYYQIARAGYYWDPRKTGQQNIAFFPAYPMATRVLARLFGGAGTAYIVAGVVLSHAAFLWSLLLLYQLARATLGGDAAARGAVLLTATYPFSVFYGAIYTESLFLLGAVGACLEFTRARWAPAIAFGVLTGLTRPNGFLLALPLLVMALASWRGRAGSRWHTMVLPGMAVAAPVAGMAIFSAYLAALTGNPLAWSAQHAAWGRTFTGVGPMLASVRAIIDNGLVAYVAASPYDVINGAAALLVAATIIPVGRRLGPAYAVFIAVNLLPPLLMGGTMSMGRVTSTMFPVFLWLAAVAPKSAGSIAVVFALLQGFFAVLFYTWRPLA